MAKAIEASTPSRRALLCGAVAASALAAPAALASVNPGDQPNDAKLSALVDAYVRLRNEACVIRDRLEDLEGALGISSPPSIECPMPLTEMVEALGAELTPSLIFLHRVSSEAQIERDYEGLIRAYGPEMVGKRDRHIERFRQAKAEWDANREREDVKQLREAENATWESANAIEREIRATRPDTLRGLVTQLRFLAWTEIGSAYADTPLEDHDWGDAGLLTILADAERLAGVAA
jgi:hypothetical protein